ncbi:MAG: ORF6N domain-containing protein [Bacilli bacterium]
MNEIIVKDNIKIENLIYEIRGKQVMLDSDLAMLYGCKNGTKSLNLAVKRHINRFPERFMFQLTKEEYSSIYSRFQIETLNKNNQKQGLNIKYLPYVFTEQGVAMLSAILKTDVAEEISIKIMDAFVAMKNIINTSLIEQKYINSLVLEHDNEIRLLQESFNKLSTKEKINHIFYNGQIYDAYSLLIDILNKAKKEIIIIDNYAGKELFDITKDIKVNIKIYTKNIDEISKKKYMQEYSNIEIITTDIFHDRFIILDNKELYNLGSSLKDIGKKCTSINRIEDSTILKELISRLTKIK